MHHLYFYRTTQWDALLALQCYDSSVCRFVHLYVCLSHARVLCQNS